MYEPHGRRFEFTEFMLFSVSSSSKICSIKFEIVAVLFVSVSSESFLLRYPAPGVSSFQFDYMSLDF